MKAILIKTDGTWIEVEPKNEKDFKLEELYDLLDCTIVELLHLSTGEYMLVDEEGKLRHSPILNPLASRIYLKDYIMGNALICSRSQFK